MLPTESHMAISLAVKAPDTVATFARFPLTEEMAWPFIKKLLPVPAVSNVLLVNKSVVALPTTVSEAS